MPEEIETSSPPAADGKRRWTTDEKLVAGSVGAAALGLILPWARVLFFQVSGLDAGDGQLFAAILAGAALLGWRATRSEASPRWQTVAFALCALAMSAVTARLIGELQGTDVAAPGGGLFLSFAGAIGLVAVAHRAWFGPKLNRGAAAIAAVLVVGAWIGGTAAAEDVDLGSEFSEPAEADAIRARIGEVVGLDGADVAVTGVRSGHKDEMFDSDPVLLVSVEVTNTSDAEEYFDASDWSVVLPSGEIESGSYSGRDDQLDAFLAPGGSAGGTVALPLGEVGVYEIRFSPLYEPLVEWRVEIDE